MQSELKTFCDSIMNINASAISMFGGALPGMAGKSAAEQGAMTPAADMIYELKHSVANFSQAYRQKDTEKFRQEAKNIEGFLTGLQTLSILDEKQSEQLIDKLHRLVANG